MEYDKMGSSGFGCWLVSTIYFKTHSCSEMITEEYNTMDSSGPGCWLVNRIYYKTDSFVPKWSMIGQYSVL